GEVLTQLGYPQRAVEAFEVALHQEPRLHRAHRWLAELYRTTLNVPEKAAEHLRLADELG
ncbi:MAG: hypothetical protein AAFN13_02330, partial [Bacteroidota bacterium]